MTRHLPVVAVDAVTSLEDRFRCDVFSTELSARTCLKRQGARIEVARHANGASASRATHERCARCAVGQDLQARVAAPEQPITRAVLTRRYTGPELVAAPRPVAPPRTHGPRSPELREAILATLARCPRSTTATLAAVGHLASESTARRALQLLVDAGVICRPSFGFVALAKGAPR